MDFGPGSRRGVALVVTLIMLAIITFLAVAFLVLSQRENASSNTAMDQKTAKMAADTALNRVCAELLANAMVNTNFQNFGIKVSTNYINYNGFNNLSAAYFNPTNVNYDYEIGGQPYGGGAVELQRNISDLLYNPRAPVFVVTNSGTGAMDFRFYVDLNRNGRFDTNGTWPAFSGNPNFPLINATNGVFEPMAFTNTGPVLSNNFVGDPEWIGVLERPQELHSADNRFVSRYAYLVVPAGNTLDINSVHNRAKRLTAQGEGFLRNQGVGTFEINLAGFLADLNTNMWWTNSGTGVSQYIYNTNLGGISSGLAFSNANDLLSYRYGTPGYGSLISANNLFQNAFTTWGATHIDLYANGPLMLGNNPSNTPIVFNPWSGADNSNHVWSIQDFFNSSLLSGSSFPNNLQTLSKSNDSYNAYTYYRMLSQLGSDSAPEKGKLNINWKNTDNHGNVVPGMETNLQAWTPIDFFTNAASRMFQQLNMRDFYGNLITVTNIPIYEDPLRNGGTNINFYTPAVHRILQLAANIYDASTPQYINNKNYPSVFRPVFSTEPNGVAAITGFVEVTNTAVDPSLTLPFMDASNYVFNPQANVNIYGVPWVIGAKKGFPNFNAMAMYNDIGVTRKLEFTNTTGVAGRWSTNQLFEFGITNSFGMEGWNSYTNAYGQNLIMTARNYLTLLVTNQAGIPLVNVNNLLFQNSPDYNNPQPPLNVANWPGWGLRAPPNQDNSFIVPMVAVNNFTNANYLNSGLITAIAPTTWTATTNARLFVGFTFKMQYFLVDPTAKRVVDFVNLVGTRAPIDVTGQLANFADAGANHENTIDNNTIGNAGQTHLWETNTTLLNGVNLGVYNQMQADQNMHLDPTPGHSQVNNFITELGGNKSSTGANYFEDWYHPTVRIFQTLAWQVNDPLVHYVAQDMDNTNANTFVGAHYDGVFQNPQSNPELAVLTNLNYSYHPWGGRHLPPNGGDLNQGGGQETAFDFNFQVKDAGVQQSDNWDFPTNKFWDVGILGRVHRGTPWQTVNLKPYNSGLVNNWVNWTNWNNDVLFTFTNSVTYPSGVPVTNLVLASDGLMTQPNQDYLLFDLFTSTPNENSTLGQLNINQPGLAAWSAIFSGVNVLTNNSAGQLGPATISPAGVYDPNNPTPLARIWEGITFTRTNNNITNGPVFPNGTFQHLGDILNVPQLTYASPFFINTNTLGTLGAGGMSDEALERIPQQVMSLLTLNQDPRFVIYSFGQTLHPADHSQVTGGSFNGLCTNYQITAETATRAVVRVEGSPDPQWTKAHPDSQGRYYPPHIVVEQFNVLGPD